MKVSKSSWHYRLIKYLNRWPEENLCPYFRQVIYAVLSAAFFVLAALLIASFYAYFITYPVWQWFYEGLEGIPALSSFVWMVTGAVFIAVYRAERRFYKAESLFGPAWLHKDLLGFINIGFEPHEEKPPGLIAERIRAAHDKVCPQIEFTRENDT